MTEMHTTQDRETIIAWAERRDAHAARVVGVREDAPDAEVEVGALRIGFPGYASEEQLEPMSWDEWFAVFDDEGWTFGYRETTAKGHPSNEYDLLK
jgi:hypothetical protein